MKHISTIFLLAALPCFTTSLAQPPGVKGDRPTHGVTVQAGALVSTESDLDEGGTVSVDRWALDASYRLPLPSDVRTRIGYGYESRVYDADGTRVFETLPDDAEAHSINANLSGPINDTWSWMATPALNWSTMGDADNDGDALNFRGLGLALWEQRPGLTWSFGALFRTELEESGRIIPILGVTWDITDRLRLRTADEVVLNYAFDDKRVWSAEVSVVPRTWEYRIEENNAETSEGVFRDQRWMLWGSVRYQPNPGMALRAIAGTSFNERYTIYDKRGDRILGDSGDGPLHMGLEFSVRL